MKVITLIENRVSKSKLVAEHGLAFYIESDDSKLLFDTGAGENFAKNAKELGIDLTDIDYLILSHGHNDHTGGLAHFIEINNKAKILMKKETVWPKFKFDKSIGVSTYINLNNDRISYVDEPMELFPSVFIMPSTQLYFPIDQHKKDFFTQKEGKIIEDQFDDELFLVVKSTNYLSVISSCSHNGITNMLETAKRHFNLPIKTVIGGFHLKNETNGISKHISSYFNKENIKDVHTCHCTGIEKFAEIQTNTMGKVVYNETGCEILI